MPELITRCVRVDKKLTLLKKSPQLKMNLFILHNHFATDAHTHKANLAVDSINTVANLGKSHLWGWSQEARRPGNPTCH